MTTAVRLPRARPPLLPPAYPPLPVRRFTVDEYHQLIQVGILKSGDPFELINGWIVPKMPTNPTHASLVRRLDRLLQRMLGDNAVVGVQQPVTTADSEPEPDVTVCRGPEDRYFMGHPTPDLVHFVIEVSDSTVAYDRGEKRTLYARAKVPEYWVVDVTAHRVEVYTQPRGGKSPTYRSRQEYGPGQAVPVRLGGRVCGSIALNELLP